MKGDNVEISIQIGGEWRPLKHVDVGRGDDQSVVHVLKSTGETVTLDIEKTKAFLKEQNNCYGSHGTTFFSPEAIKNLVQAMNVFGSNAVEIGTILHEHYEELLKRKEHKIDIFGGCRSGRRFMYQEIQTSLCKQPACYCLKCRVGQSHQCMTFSPKKRRGK